MPVSIKFLSGVMATVESGKWTSIDRGMMEKLNIVCRKEDLDPFGYYPFLDHALAERACYLSEINMGIIVHSVNLDTFVEDRIY